MKERLRMKERGGGIKRRRRGEASCCSVFLSGGWDRTSAMWPFAASALEFRNLGLRGWSGAGE